MPHTETKHQRAGRLSPWEQEGFVYLLRNKAMPGIYKIGMTFVCPYRRAAQLAAPTGVAVPFEVAYWGLVTNPRFTEKAVHREFEFCRVNDRREFFMVDPRSFFLHMEEYHFDHEVDDWMHERICSHMGGECTLSAAVEAAAKKMEALHG